MSTITIDRAGRVVIPKKVRDRLQLAPGDSLELETAGDQITLRPARSTGGTRKEKGIWVHHSEIPLTQSTAELIDQAREERIVFLSR